MQNIRLFLISFLLTVTLFPAVAAEKGEKSVGLKGGYCTRNESPVAGVYFQYAFSHHFRISPNVDYIFRNDGCDGFTFGLTAQFPIGITGSRFDIYPLAGISYSIWNLRHHDSAGEIDDVTTRESRFGLDVGMGVEYRFASALKLFAQGRFNWVKDYNTGVFVIGIGYEF